ncbi:hypothetical protein Mth01_20730 [Sphaerimonospora thailandensis]|uniref:Uncharacterized protein n=1 Tax=Sphaerimonospora thailandensis TaxID=795644 RepID=A0A8J3R7J6_9ACTN|nr:hypothetical protein Mth01_20730 [Sphaerimonospora thailandensis]
MSPTGKAMVQATPMDVIRIRIASFVLLFCVAVGILSAASREFWLTGVVAVIALGVVISIAFAVRKQRKLGGGPESRG